jgi:hypothetical protein
MDDALPTFTVPEPHPHEPYDAFLRRWMSAFEDFANRELVPAMMARVMAQGRDSTD